MRFFLAFIASGIAVSVIDSMAVFWIVLLGTWGLLHVLSPGTCPHCRKGVKFMADTCHHCGKSVKEEKPKPEPEPERPEPDIRAVAARMGLPADDPAVEADLRQLAGQRTEPPPPGWYEAPGGGGRRYWDGKSWTA